MPRCARRRTRSRRRPGSWFPRPPSRLPRPHRRLPPTRPSHARRYDADSAALGEARPHYSFWQHIFSIPDGHIVFGSGTDGRLLAAFPTRGNWARDGEWSEPGLADTLAGRRLPRRLSDRRERLEELFAPQVGPVVHNPARGRFLAPHARRYGNFLREWGLIYERFGVPAEIGLAQAVVESGLNGRARSSARALGLCQWLPRNWNFLKRLSPNVIEGYNQTTQAPFCAAHLSILATMYGSFIPALSEHHAGGVNVGRTVINGERLGGRDTREQYLLGSDFARSLREISIRRYRDLFRTYGPRSALYAEMIFGNVHTVERLIDEMPQSPVIRHARAAQHVAVDGGEGQRPVARTRSSATTPALVRRVPARANVYLPEYIAELRSRRVVLASAAKPGVRGRPRRVRPARRQRAGVARGRVRGDGAVVPAALRRHRHRGGHGDGDDAGLHSRQPHRQPPGRHPRGVPGPAAASSGCSSADGASWRAAPASRSPA